MNEAQVPKRTVAIVDDNRFMRVFLRKILEKNGYCVVGEFTHAEDLINNFLTLHPDVVTMDLVMEGVGGLQALEKIMEINPAARVVMISAVGRTDVIIQAIKKGARDYIVKPFVEKSILATLDKLF